MSHKPLDQYLPTLSEGNVRKTGGALSLGAGEFGIVKLGVNTSKGAPIVSDFSTITDKDKLALRVGAPNVGVTRSLDNLAISSLPFTLKDIKSIIVDVPTKKGITTDEFVIGWNGTDGTEISLSNGDNETIELSVSGISQGMLGLPKSFSTISVAIEAPNTGVKGTDWTDHEIIENAVAEFKRANITGNVPLTEYVDITPVNSTNPASLTGASAFSYYNLILSDNGTFTDLGNVQAQYPNLDVRRSYLEGGESTYTVIEETAEVVTAGSFVIGQEYTITTVGTTDFTLIGAADNNVGTRFVATGSGSGTGTATEVKVADYQPKTDFLLKGCESCPESYTLLNEGFVYQVELEDDGTDRSADVQTIANAVGASAVKNGQGDNGVGYYSVVTTQELTQAEIQTFVDTYPTAEVTFIAENVNELCQGAVKASVAWVDSGETCNAVTETYTIQLADTKCGDSRLTELQEAYPELTITEVAASAEACQRKYQTTVTSNVVCEDCSEVYRGLFDSEAPRPFDLKEWEKAAKVYDANAKMGIKFKAKASILSGSEEYRDEMPFVYTSARLSLVGGEKSFVNESYKYGDNGRFTVTLLSIATEPQNVGGMLRKYEDEGRAYFNGMNRHKGNNYGKLVMGEETRLEGTKQYLDYVVSIEKRRFSQSFQNQVDEAISYHIYVEPGKHYDLESVLNGLAIASGVDTVKAYPDAV